MLTQTNPTTNYAGSMNPFVTENNKNTPSTTAPYSREWETASDDQQRNGHITNIQPGDEFKLVRSDTNDYVRFVVHRWCGWNSRSCVLDTSQSSPHASWDGHSPCGHSGSQTCEADTKRHFAIGQLYDSQHNPVAGVTHFNLARQSAAFTAGCDAAAFSKKASFAQGDGTGEAAYGAAWKAASNTCVFFWGHPAGGSPVEVTGTLNYYWRRNQGVGEGHGYPEKVAPGPGGVLPMVEPAYSGGVAGYGG